MHFCFAPVGAWALHPAAHVYHKPGAHNTGKPTRCRCAQQQPRVYKGLQKFLFEGEKEALARGSQGSSLKRKGKEGKGKEKKGKVRVG
eukprot:1141055-Pelagomonas_calceolata.AAC.3